jgi:hypothetical protein
MMNVPQILDTLASLGNEGTKKVLEKHGAREPFFGVRIGDMKPLQKKLKKQYELALALYKTGNSDAMYLAGLLMDENAISKADLQNWVEKAYWYLLSEYTVAQVAAESPYGFELAKEWIHSDKESIAAAGWSTFSHLVSIKPDDELDLVYLAGLLNYLAACIHQQPDRVRYTMNGFMIAAGSFVPELTTLAKTTAATVGTVQVNMGDTACKVPDALAYLSKMEKMQRIGKKKQRARC